MDKHDLITISGHTIIKPETVGMNVLNIGSRRHDFARPMANMGCSVCAVEPDDDVKLPPVSGITLIRGAVVGDANAGALMDLAKWSSGEGNHLVNVSSVPKSAVLQQTKCYSMRQIMAMTGMDFWDIVKMDCEGSEYEILLDWPGPIAGQITVEFHDFTGSNPGGEDTYDKIFEHIGQWYDIVQHEGTVRFNLPCANYWDSLFVLKEGISK